MQFAALPRLRGFVLLLLMVGVTFAILLTAVHARTAQAPAAPSPANALSSAAAPKDEATTVPGPKAAAKGSKLDKTKSDAAELSTLADQLADELNKMNVNVFSLDVLHKTEKVEKLAKKIKEEVHGD